MTSSVHPTLWSTAPRSRSSRSRSDRHQARAPPTVGSHLIGFEEEIDATFSRAIMNARPTAKRSLAPSPIERPRPEWYSTTSSAIVNSTTMMHALGARRRRKAPKSCKLDHAGPPLGKRSDIDVVFAHEVELAVFAHAEHGKAGRDVHHLIALTLRGGSKRSG